MKQGEVRAAGSGVGLEGPIRTTARVRKAHCDMGTVEEFDILLSLRVSSLYCVDPACRIGENLLPKWKS